jgi:hypothetical protein
MRAHLGVRGPVAAFSLRDALEIQEFRSNKAVTGPRAPRWPAIDRGFTLRCCRRRGARCGAGFLLLARQVMQRRENPGSRPVV